MSINSGFIDKEELNSTFVSKRATGSQIMAGSLRMLGALTVDGAARVGSLTTNQLNVSSLTASGTVTANLFSGSGASLTNLPAANLTGTVANARLASEVMLTNKVQTVTANLTMSAAANLYFAGNTTYYVNTAGDAKFKSLITAGDITLSTNNKLVFQDTNTAVPGDTSVGARISLQGSKFQIGVEASSIWYDSSVYHRFYTNDSTTTRTERFNVNTSGVKVTGDALITNNLEVEGEVKTGGANEFPDPLLMSRSIAEWGIANGTLVMDAAQKPTGTNAIASIKITATDADARSLYNNYFGILPNEWVTFSAYLFATTAGKSAKLHICWYNAAKEELSKSTTTIAAPTAWARQRITAQAPTDAAFFCVQIDNNGGTGTVMYFSAFQVERGKALTLFKPYSGGEMASFTQRGIKLGSGGQIDSAYNNGSIFKDHSNGNITINAAGGVVYMGYQNTTGILFSADLKTSTGTTISNTEGALYYKGSDIDSRYVKTSGGTVTGTLTVKGAYSPPLILERTAEGTTSVGMSFKNTVGQIHLGGIISGASNSSMFGVGLSSDLNTSKFKVNVDTGETKINDNVVWHAGNDGAGSGLDADTVDGVQLASLVQTSRTITAGTGLSGGGTLAADRTISFNTTWGDARYLSTSAKAADADKLDGLDSESFLRSDASDTFTGTLTLNGKLNLTGDMDFSGLPVMKDIAGEHREGQKLNLLSRMAGRIVNKNGDFIAGSLSGYNAYDNRNTGRVALNLVSDDTVPNANGKVMRVSYNPTIGDTMPSPEFGGFSLVISRDTSTLNSWSYRAGNRYLFRVIAKIPTGRRLLFNSNTLGDGHDGKWLTSQDGTNNWQEYLYLQTAGTTGTFSSTGFFYIMDGANEGFTWDVSLCQMIGLDEMPDVDRAPTLNVGYKATDLSWGDIYASGKMMSDGDIETHGKITLKSNVSMIQNSTANSFINLQNSSGNMHIKANDGSKTLYIDSDTVVIRKSDGSTRITLSPANVITLHDNVIANRDVTVGGDLTINKTGYSSKIVFKEQTNDIGLIEHYENNNVSRMYFSTGNESDDTDYFGFGSTTQRENAKITSAGNAIFKGTTAETLTVSGQTTLSGRVHFAVPGNSAAQVTFGTLGLGQVKANSGELILSNLEQLRFGSSSGWSWNSWAGIKYDSATSKLIIGGPASSNFDSNTNPSRINLSFEGLEDAKFDGKVVINPITASSISMTDLTQSYLLVGTPTAGLGLDPNEIAFTGAAAYISTTDSNDIVLNTNKTERLRLRLTGAKITGALEVTDTVTASSGISIPSTKVLSVGTLGNKSKNIELSHDGTNSAFNYGGDLILKANNVDRIRMGANGHVGIGLLPSDTYHLRVPDFISESWIRTLANTGWYSEAWGGGWHMKDSTWIRAYNNKSLLVDTGTIRTDAKLQVGSNAQLEITPTSLNWRDTIFSNTAGKVSINKTSNSTHPLDVKSNGSYQGINIQNTAVTDVSGLSFQNADGKYTWHLASSAIANSNLSIFSGLDASLSALPEVLTFNAAGGLWTSGDIVTNTNVMIRGGSGLTEAPSIDLAIGDGDTGLNWVSSGVLQIMANNTEAVRFTSGTVTVTPALLVNNHISFNSSNGRGLRFWNNDNYKIYMSATGDTTWGGGISTAPTSDYNIYFRMVGSGTRGFVFEGGTGKLAQIHGDGKIYTKSGFRNGNFEITHNTTEDSLDFTYMG